MKGLVRGIPALPRLRRTQACDWLCILPAWSTHATGTQQQHHTNSSCTALCRIRGRGHAASWCCTCRRSTPEPGHTARPPCQRFPLLVLRICWVPACSLPAGVGQALITLSSSSRFCALSSSTCTGAGTQCLQGQVPDARPTCLPACLQVRKQLPRHKGVKSQRAALVSARVMPPWPGLGSVQS